MELLPSLFRAIKFIIVLLFIFFSYYPQQPAAMSKPHHNNLTDMESLLAFRASASDPYGILATNWTTGASLCTWIGVVCSQRRQRVTELALDSFSLAGTISPHIANLSFLNLIRLSNNSLTGTIPDGIGRLPRLARLIIEKNSLSGPIPPSIFNMSSLITLAFTYNNLTGPLPGLAVLPQLRIMYLSSNMLTGRIPSGLLSRCALLEGLSLSINEFSGSIPAELGNLTSLNELYLGRNHLTGTIPSTLGNLTGLYELDVSTNHLEGVIPEELGNLLNLQRLSLDNNTLTGSIPLALLNASSLYFVQLAGNNLTGSVPATIGKYWPRLAILTMEQNQLTGGLDFITSLADCKEFKLLDMSENEIRGVLPGSIANLSAGLEYIYAWQNFIRGEIPAGIGNLSNLLRVELGLNELEGSIPTTLSGLKRLQGLTLHDNKLSGSIPSQLGTMVSLSELHLEINTLSGAIPHSVGNLSNLQHLVLGDNKLVSEIPGNLWSLTGLIELSLSGNSLSGTLPGQVGNLKSLDTLYLSNNRLSGNISSALGDLQMIRELDVSKNSLQGEIPQSFGRLINVEYLNLSYNFLSGSIPKPLANLRYLGSLDLSFNKLEGEIPQGRVFSNLSIPSLKGNAALCGAPGLGFPPCSSSTVLPSHSKSKLNLLKYTLPPLLFIFLLSCIFLILVCFCRRSTKPEVPPIDTSLNNHRVISYHELVRATNNFNDADLIGRGSVSSVFKACLDDGSLAAVKVLNAQVQGAPGSFDAECRTLSTVRHRNLIKIISVCSNSEFKALVLEYMANGSLEKWLHSPTFYLNLLQRINVMVDVSLALEYLHHHHPHVVVHRDVKPGNVLLDENMMAHVGDFGIAKLFLGDDSTTMLSASAQGTIGYMPPEYGYRGKVSRKGDVYSFGILLLETFTRKRPSDAMFGGDLSLKKWVSDAYPHAVLEIVDSDIFMEEYSADQQPEILDTVQQCLSSIVELGLLCSRDSQKERPLMSDVVLILNKTKMGYLSKLSGS